MTAGYSGFMLKLFGATREMDLLMLTGLFGFLLRKAEHMHSVRIIGC